MGRESIIPVIHKAKSKRDAISRLNMVLKDCKNWRKWDNGDPGNWSAMAKNVEATRNWIKEDVSSKGVWEVKRNVKS